MALEDKIIVAPEHAGSLYKIPNPERYLSVLRDMDILPLTVKSLTTDRGQALLHLATWTYFSGLLSRPKFKLIISGNNDFLDSLLQAHLKPLGKRFKKDDDINCIYLAEDAGVIGRLIYSMGVPMPNNNSRTPLTKPYYLSRLPHYFTDIIESQPSDDAEKADKLFLLYTISKILFKDRLKVNIYPDCRNKIYLQLNSHKNSESAREYGRQFVIFLNEVFKREHNQDLFFESQVRVIHNTKNELYICRLSFTDEQLGDLFKRNPPIFNFQVNY